LSLNKPRVNVYLKFKFLWLCVPLTWVLDTYGVFKGSSVHLTWQLLSKQS
jgi:hypothetical protein